MEGNPLFGDWGDVPRAEGARYVDTPIGEPCMWCKEEVQDGEVGEMMPSYVGQHDHDGGQDAWRIVACHRECQMLHIVGHEYGVCSCTNWADCDTQREAALLCWQRMTEQGAR